jgi:hypothetical protein
LVNTWNSIVFYTYTHDCIMSLRCFIVLSCCYYWVVLVKPAARSQVLNFLTPPPPPPTPTGPRHGRRITSSSSFRTFFLPPCCPTSGPLQCPLHRTQLPVRHIAHQGGNHKRLPPTRPGAPTPPPPGRPVGYRVAPFLVLFCRGAAACPKPVDFFYWRATTARPVEYQLATTWDAGGHPPSAPLFPSFRSVVGISMEPSVVGRDWSPVSSNKARGCCCRTSCRPPSPIAAEACSPAVFAHACCIASQLPGVRGRAGAQAAGAPYASYRPGLFFFIGVLENRLPVGK